MEKNKKQKIVVIGLLLAAVIIGSVVTVICIVNSLSAEAGVYAVVSMPEGEDVIVEEAPDAAVMLQADSYELFIADEEEPILTVECAAPETGSSIKPTRYYSVDFTLANANAEIFLAGLCDENVMEVQQCIIDYYVRGRAFSIADLNFIDAEKTYQNDADDNLCWAASAADMLTYTGWAAQAGYANEDDLLDSFMTAFNNHGALAFAGIGWFFNGSTLGFSSLGEMWAKAVPGTGGYLNDYACDIFSDFWELNIWTIDEVAGLLRNGYGIGVGLDIYYAGDNTPHGHAVTMWGYIVDTRLPENYPGRYLNVFLSDSDTYEGIQGNYASNRRQAYNVLTVYPVTVTGDGYYRFNYSSDVTAVITDYTYLAPYSETAVKETDRAATKNRRTAPDLRINYLQIDDGSGTSSNVYQSGSSLWFCFEMMNLSDVSYTGPINLNLTLTSSDDRTLMNETASLRETLDPLSYIVTDWVGCDPLPAGDYLLTCTINPGSHTSYPAEAYYCNNTAVFTVAVRDGNASSGFWSRGDISSPLMCRSDPRRSVATRNTSVHLTPEELAEILSATPDEAAEIAAFDPLAPASTDPTTPES